MLQSNLLVLAHNHPSGSAQPSELDIQQTLRLREFLGPLEIELVDHFIVAMNETFSFRMGMIL